MMRFNIKAVFEYTKPCIVHGGGGGHKGAGGLKPLHSAEQRGIAPAPTLFQDSKKTISRICEVGYLYNPKDLCTYRGFHECIILCLFFIKCN